MNIGNIPIALAQSGSLSNVETAVLSKSLQNAEETGKGLIKMLDSAALERSINPSVGSNFDMVV